MYEELEMWNAEMAKTVKWIEENEQAKELFNECGFQYKEKAKQNVNKLKVKFNTNHMLIDNPSKSVSSSDFTEFDKWLNKLIKKNGVTKY